MRYADLIKNYILEGDKNPDISKDTRSGVKRLMAKDVRSGKMNKRQRVARIWSDARRRGDTDRANSLMKLYKRMEGLDDSRINEGDWIQGAVNPAHKGYCTPMTKATCTPRRKALAKRFKKAARKKKHKGGTGWQGKV